jgi:hypothetical protein
VCKGLTIYYGELARGLQQLVPGQQGLPVAEGPAVPKVDGEELVAALPDHEPGATPGPMPASTQAASATEAAAATEATIAAAERAAPCPAQPQQQERWDNVAQSQAQQQEEDGQGHGHEAGEKRAAGVGAEQATHHPSYGLAGQDQTAVLTDVEQLPPHPAVVAAEQARQSAQAPSGHPIDEEAASASGRHKHKPGCRQQ